MRLEERPKRAHDIRIATRVARMRSFCGTCVSVVDLSLRQCELAERSTEARRGWASSTSRRMVVVRDNAKRLAEDKETRDAERRVLYNFDQLFAGCAARHVVRRFSCSQVTGMRDNLFARARHLFVLYYTLYCDSRTTNKYTLALEHWEHNFNACSGEQNTELKLTGYRKILTAGIP
jgi:hypothetical protein